jgi:hypothetical protein
MQEKERTDMKLSFIDNHSRQIQGVLHYRVFKNGALIEETEEENLIVTAGRAQMARLLAGDFAGKQITKISFGTSGAAPALSDTKIANPFTKNLNGFSYPANGQVKFSWNLATTEANGKAILEFGLVCADATVFSRRIRESGKPINKESDISLEGDWTVIF